MPEHFLGMHSVRVWWPRDSTDVLPYLRQYPFLSVMQCNDSLASDLAEVSFRSRPFHTSLLDLSLSEEELWSGLARKSCRHEISRARKTEHNVLINQQIDQARSLINQFINRTGYRKPISARDWNEMMVNCDVFVAQRGAETAAAHVLLRDEPHRIRLLLSATMDRSDSSQRSLAGALNRNLHWEEIVHYKRLGIRHYDFGGIDVRPNSPLYPISRFKLSFGGGVIKENTLRLAGNAVLRSMLRGAVTVKGSLRGGGRGDAL